MIPMMKPSYNYNGGTWRAKRAISIIYSSTNLTSVVLQTNNKEPVKKHHIPIQSL